MSKARLSNQASSINIEDQILIFLLDEQPYALPLPVVIKVIHSIEIKHLPHAPEIIVGIINVKGQIIPVANLRRKIGLKEHEINAENQIIIANTTERIFAIPVDSVIGIRELRPGQLTLAKESVPFTKHINGVAKIDDNLVLIYDLEKFLNLGEEKMLDNAMLEEFNES